MADTVIKRVGGKVKLAKWIATKLPPHNKYVEPFGGSFAVGLSLGTTPQVLVYNDLDEHIHNFFAVLRYHKDEFMWQLVNTPYSRQEFEEAHDIINGVDKAFKKLNSVEWARLYLISNRQSFAGKEDNTWCISKNGENICVTWKNLPPAVEALSEQLKSAYIENHDYKEIFRRWDEPDTCFYIDPPYVAVENDYYHVNKEGGFDHVELARCVKELKGSAVISYYDSASVRKLYEGFDVEVANVVKHMTRSGKGKKDKEKAQEILFIKVGDWAKQSKGIFDEME